MSLNIVEKAIAKSGGIQALSEKLDSDYQSVWKAKKRGYFSLKQMILIRKIYPEITTDEMVNAYETAANSGSLKD